MRVFNQYEYLPENLRILRTKAGKPYLADYPDVYFSISHTRNIWICAVDSEPMGIDCEKLERRLSDPMKMAERYFTKQEVFYLSRAKYGFNVDENSGVQLELPAAGFYQSSEGEAETEGLRLKEAFLKIWTRKEAYLKIVGKGLFGELDKFSVEDGLEEYQSAVYENENGFSAKGRIISDGNVYNLITFKSRGLIISVCTENDNKISAKDIITVDLDTFSTGFSEKNAENFMNSDGISSGGGENSLIELKSSEYEKNDIAKAKETALRILDYQDRTEAELKEKLLKKGFSEHVINAVAEDFTESGIVDDSRYARFYTQSKLSSGKGKHWIRQKLNQKGIAREITDKVFDELFEETDEYVLCLKKALSICGLDREFEADEDGEIVRQDFSFENFNLEAKGDVFQDGESGRIDYFGRKIPEGETDKNVIYKLREKAKASLTRRLLSAGYSSDMVFDAVKKIDRL
ncbi:MAG: 4'-phosphopantetheinyl transferase superfamily protein [Firmicutes bacterium]|nr:4'-phosphopantetheinyl transferase superfamily protein [Bacillota bacterium]